MYTSLPGVTTAAATTGELSRRPLLRLLLLRLLLLRLLLPACVILLQLRHHYKAKPCQHAPVASPKRVNGAMCACVTHVLRRYPAPPPRAHTHTHTPSSLQPASQPHTCMQPAPWTDHRCPLLRHLPAHGNAAHPSTNLGAAAIAVGHHNILLGILQHTHIAATLCMHLSLPLPLPRPHPPHTHAHAHACARQPEPPTPHTLPLLQP